MIPYLVVPAQAADTRSVYNVYFAAFKDEKILDLLFPGGIDDEFRAIHTSETRKFQAHCDYQYTWKCVDSASGAVVGMMLADVHMGKRGEDERLALLRGGIPWLQGEQKQRADRVLRPLWQAREQLFGPESHIYCHITAVDPTQQGKGIGGELLATLTDLADKLNLPVYLESTPRAASLYGRHGFQTLNRRITHTAEDLGTDSDVEIPLMLRMPVPSSTNGEITRCRTPLLANVAAPSPTQRNFNPVTV